MLSARALRYCHDRHSDPVIDSVSLRVKAGEIVGLTGDSGTGKSTLGQLLAGLLRPQAGRIELDGTPLPRHGLQPVQLLMQTPELAVNPRWRIERILHEAWTPDATLLEALSIRRDWYSRFPHELSGGELQRVTVARALAPGVRYLIADEISSMLDALTQAELWHALLQVVASRRMGMLVISHDAALLSRVANRCYRLNAGQLDALS